MFYHPVLVWKACYTSFAAVLCKPTSRTELNVSISSPSSEGGGKVKKITLYSVKSCRVSISSPSSEGGGHSGGVGFDVAMIPLFPLVLLQAKVVGQRQRLRCTVTIL